MTARIAELEAKVMRYHDSLAKENLARADLLAALYAVSARPRHPDEWIDEVRAAIAAAHQGEGTP